MEKSKKKMKGHRYHLIQHLHDLKDGSHFTNDKGCLSGSKNVNIDPYDPNISNFRDITLLNTRRAVHWTPSYVAVCCLVCLYFPGLSGNLQVTSSWPLSVHGGAPPASALRLQTTATFSAAKLLLSRSRTKTKHKLMFKVCPTSLHIPQVTGRKENSKMRKESPGNIFYQGWYILLGVRIFFWRI